MANEVRVLIKANSSDATKKLGDITKLSLGLTAGFAAAGVAAVKFGADFEHQMDQVGAVSSASEQDMASLRKEALKLGADTSKSAGEAAFAMEELAAGGRSVAQILGGEAKAAVALSEAGNYDLAASAETVAVSMKVWEGSALGTMDVVNRLAGAANTSRFGVDDMSAAIAMGGGVAASAGVNFQDFTTAIAATASAFSSGSDAGTAFKQFVTALTGSSAQAKATMQELGLSFYDAQGALKPMAAIVQELHDKLGPLSQEQQTVALKTIFGNDAYRTAAGLMKMTGAEFSAMSDKMKNTDAAEVARQRMGNLSGQMEQLKGSLETLGISVGSKAVPALTEVAGVATKAVNAFGALPPQTQNMVLATAALASAMPLMISGVEKGAAAVKNLGTQMTTTRGMAMGLVAGVGVAAVGLSALNDAMHESNAEMMTRMLRDANDELRGMGDAADIGAYAMGRMGEAVASITAGDNNLASVKERAREAGFEIQAMAKLMREGFDAGRLGVEDLVRASESLPPALRQVFDETVNLDAIQAGWATTQRDLGVAAADERLKMIALAQSTGKVGAAAAAALTPLQEFEASLEEGADRADEFDKALDALSGRFASFNPAVIEAKGRLAAIDEELADLTRSGGQWSETLGKTKAQLEAEKKALEDVVAAAGENEEATRGMREELKLYLGEGLMNVDAALGKTKLGFEEQVNVQIKVGAALRALKDGDIPAFIAALKQVELAAPGMANEVVKNLGPDLRQKLQGEIPALKASGDSLGAAIADGVSQGLNSAANRITATGRGIIRAAMEQMKIEAEISSPSKRTADEVGYPMGEGIAVGLVESAPLVMAAAAGVVQGGVASAAALANGVTPMPWLPEGLPDYVYPEYTPGVGEMGFATMFGKRLPYRDVGSGFKAPVAEDGTVLWNHAITHNPMTYTNREGRSVSAYVGPMGPADARAGGYTPPQVINLVVDGQVLAKVVNDNNARAGV